MAMEGTAVARLLHQFQVSFVWLKMRDARCEMRGALLAQGGPKQEMQQMAFTIAKTPYCVTHINNTWVQLQVFEQSSETMS